MALLHQGYAQNSRKRRLGRTATRGVSHPSGPRPSHPSEYDDGFSDVLLPSQFFTPSRSSHAFWRGEQRLLFAVLQDAVVCWFRFCEKRTPRERRIFAETHAWFHSEERDWLFAFERICELLDFDADYIRRGLLLWQRKALRRDAVAAGVRRTLCAQQPPRTRIQSNRG